MSTVKHLVISGGGIFGLAALGALSCLHEMEVWDIANIESMYGTSVGGIVAVVLSLGFDFTTIREYVVNQRYDDIFHLNLVDMLQTIGGQQGLFQREAIAKLMAPLFAAKSVDLNITLREFYELTRVDMHLFSVELFGFRLVDISHATHPHWLVLDAIYASSAVPIVFSPLFVGDGGEGDGGDSGSSEGCFVDGALLCNFPLDQCIRDKHPGAFEVLAINKEKNKWVDTQKSSTVNAKSTFFEFLLFLMFRIFLHKPRTAVTEQTPPPPPTPPQQHVLTVEDSMTSLSALFQFLYSIPDRTRMFDAGFEHARRAHSSIVLEQKEEEEKEKEKEE